MTEGLAIEIAKQKMLEFGIYENYLLRYRHFKVRTSEEITIKADNDLMLLITPDENIRVMSKSGIYNIQDNNLNEMQYVHSGTLKVKNQSSTLTIQVKFLQVIPKLK